MTPRIVQKIEVWPIDRLVPYVRNSRTHSDAQVAQIAASIQKFGFNVPIAVATDAGIIAGHGRLKGARKLGMPEVPVVVLDHLTEAERRAYVIADNKIAENAGWDKALLTDEMQDLREYLGAIGFSDKEFDALMQSALPPDEFPEFTENLETEHQCPKCGYKWSGGAA